MKIIAALTDPDSVRTYREGVGPPRSPARGGTPMRRHHNKLLQFLDHLAHIAVHVAHQPGVMALLRRAWGNRVVDEFFPFGGWDPFSVNAVEIPSPSS